MKVAILGSRGVPANYGGFETFAEHLGAGLVEEGVDVSVYCPAYQHYQGDHYKGIKLIFVKNYEYLFKSRSLRAFANLLYDVVSIVKASLSNSDVIYMLGYASGPALIIPRFFGKTIVVNPDGLEWKSKRWGIMAKTWLFLCEWAAARLTNGLIADAEPIRRHFNNKFAVDPITIQYGAPIFDKCDIEIRRPCDEEYYLAVARMVPETSIPLIVQGVLQSKTSRPLIIIGPSPDRKFLEESILPLVDGERIRYLGPIYDQDLLLRYRQHATALLHGHASDGTNPSLLESMGCGSPVIAIRTPSNFDVLGDNDDFYFGDQGELASAICKLEKLDPAAQLRLGESNRQVVKDRFSWALCVQRHLQAFADFHR